MAIVLLAGQTGCDLSQFLPGPGTAKPIGSDFASATPLAFDATGRATVANTLSSGKVDVYDLGRLAPGDRVVATVRAAAASTLDPTTAIFNSAGRLFGINDDRDLDAGLLESFIDGVIREPGDHYYLAITRSYFTSNLGPYEGNVLIERGGAVPVPGVQYLLINFGGGNVTVRSVGTFNLKPFNAADIDAAYTGLTDAIKTKIVETVRQNFTGTALRIATSDDAVPPPAGTFSTIHLGGFSASVFGMSEAVDLFNVNCCDDGIVYTDRFDDPFANQPSADGIGTAIGNVVAHEAGHLLGLNHVADILDLMDTTGTASTLLADQAFKVSVLDRTIFPFGEQDGMNMLLQVLGP